MKKIELEIAQISHSIAHTNSFALLLVEKKGVRRLPIVIGGFEAQAIAIGMEQVPQQRPQTHDLFKSIFEQFNLSVVEVIINNLAEGVFYAKLICKGDGNTVEIDSRTSDAIALAVRFSVPIYTYEFILASAGVMLEEGEGAEGVEETKPKSIPKKSSAKKSSSTESTYGSLSTEELKESLMRAIDEEAYETASKIRDELNKRQKSSEQ